MSDVARLENETTKGRRIDEGVAAVWICILGGISTAMLIQPLGWRGWAFLPVYLLANFAIFKIVLRLFTFGKDIYDTPSSADFTILFSIFVFTMIGALGIGFIPVQLVWGW